MMRTITKRFIYLAIIGVLVLSSATGISPAAEAQSNRETQWSETMSWQGQYHEAKATVQNQPTEAIQRALRTHTRAGGPSVSQRGGVSQQFAHARPQTGQTGTVKWFSAAKGFGFITPDDGSEDLYAHFSAITMNGSKTVKEGTRVSYDVLIGPKGKQGSNVQLLGK